MKRLILAVICVALMILDNTLMPFIAVKNGSGSLLFIFIISYSIINDYNDAVEIGVFSGLLQDLYMVDSFGVNALVNMLLCVAACKIGENIFKERRIIPVMSILFLSLVKGLIVYFIYKVMGIYMNIMPAIISSVYSFVLGLFMYKKIYNFCERPFMRKQWRF